MTVKELINILNNYPPDISIRVLTKDCDGGYIHEELIDTSYGRYDNSIEEYLLLNPY